MNRSSRRKGQTTTEYMLVVAAISIAAMFALAYISDPNKPVQQAAQQVSNNYADGLANGGSNTQMQAN